MREKKLAILVLQETHLTKERKCELERWFPKLLIITSYDHDNPSERADIAVVLHKDLTLTENVSMTEIEQGRVIIVQTRWHTNEKPLSILAIYAPNDGVESENFFRDVKGFLEDQNQLRNPDLMLGDFNMVEEAIDCLLMHNDHKNTVNALAAINDKYRLLDGWRAMYPATKNYTFMQSSTNSRSQIDRIYVTKAILEEARNWQINIVSIPTDHMLASVQIAHPENPKIGPGWWTMKKLSITNQEVTKYAREKGIQAMEKLADIRLNGRSEESNPQIVWYNYKKNLATKMKKIDRKNRCIMDSKMKAVQKELQVTQNDNSLTEEERCEKAGVLTEKLEDLIRTKHTKNREDLATKIWVDGEIMTRSIAKRGKASKPRDNIKALKKKDSTEQNPIYEKCSRKMAEMA
jgi:exonuclease III